MLDDVLDDVMIPYLCCPGTLDYSPVQKVPWWTGFGGQPDYIPVEIVCGGQYYWYMVCVPGLHTFTSIYDTIRPVVAKQTRLALMMMNVKKSRIVS